MLPNESLLVLKTYLLPMAFAPLGNSTRFQTPLLCMKFISSFIASYHKLDSRTISGYFIGYVERSKGYSFYCPNHITRIVESRNAKFLENDLISENDQLRDLGSEIDHIES